MHQNKPTAPITYLNDKGVKTPVDVDTSGHSLYLTLKELALLQTLSNRSLLNCNCNLDKNVMKSIVDKINKGIWHIHATKEGKEND